MGRERHKAGFDAGHAALMQEILLSGGRSTAGVVRIGSTVRRPPPGNAEFVHALLRQLESRGLQCVPRFLGLDEAGREILSYLPGDVPAELGWIELPPLRAAARLLRRLHDATAECALKGGSEIVCHGDASPCNCVFVAAYGDGAAWNIVDVLLEAQHRLLASRGAKPETRDWALACSGWTEQNSKTLLAGYERGS